MRPEMKIQALEDTIKLLRKQGWTLTDHNKPTLKNAKQDYLQRIRQINGADINLKKVLLVEAAKASTVVFNKLPAAHSIPLTLENKMPVLDAAKRTKTTFKISLDRLITIFEANYLDIRTLTNFFLVKATPTAGMTLCLSDRLTFDTVVNTWIDMDTSEFQAWANALNRPYKMHGQNHYIYTNLSTIIHCQLLTYDQLTSLFTTLSGDENRTQKLVLIAAAIIDPKSRIRAYTNKHKHIPKSTVTWLTHKDTDISWSNAEEFELSKRILESTIPLAAPTKHVWQRPSKRSRPDTLNKLDADALSPTLICKIT